jgi:hypothetical protein
MHFLQSHCHCLWSRRPLKATALRAALLPKLSIVPSHWLLSTGAHCPVTWRGAQAFLEDQKQFVF